MAAFRILVVLCEVPAVDIVDIPVVVVVFSDKSTGICIEHERTREWLARVVHQSRFVNKTIRGDENQLF